MSVNYLYGRCWNYVEGCIFCVPHVNSFVEYLYKGLLEKCLWDSEWFDEWKAFRLQFSYLIFFSIVESVNRSTHKEYWDLWCRILYHTLSRLHQNLNRGFAVEDKIFDVSQNEVVKDEGSYSCVGWKHGVCYVEVAMRLVGINVGNRGKFKVMRVKYYEYEYE